MRVRIDRPAHGGYGIAASTGDTPTIFVVGGLPGDILDVTITKAKKNMHFASITAVVEPGEYRIEDPAHYRCPAAAAGAGCCDFAAVKPDREAELKRAIAADQLRHLAGLENLPIDIVPIDSAPGWRTRLRLGVDPQGRAGVRVASGHAIVTTACSAADPRLYAELEGLRFTPGAEVTAVVDSTGQVHITESKRPARGQRVEGFRTVHAGNRRATMRVGEDTFTLSPTGFWQAHRDVPEVFSHLIEQWFAHSGGHVGWDLYGGVGALAPALSRQLAADGLVVSVDTSKPGASTLGEKVRMVRGRVDDVVARLPHPDLIVLDPPRTGAGREVIAACAQAAPTSILHFACDPATGARDIASWIDAGFTPQKLWLVNAFPASHHLELVVGLRSASTAPKPTVETD